MVSSSLSRHFIRVMAGGRKNPLPPPLFPCVWVFALQRIGQSDSAQPSLQIALFDENVPLIFTEIKFSEP
jgi:hypothetical protein